MLGGGVELGRQLLRGGAGNGGGLFEYLVELFDAVNLQLGAGWLLGEQVGGRGPQEVPGGLGQLNQHFIGKLGRAQQQHALVVEYRGALKTTVNGGFFDTNALEWAHVGEGLDFLMEAHFKCWACLRPAACGNQRE